MRIGETFETYSICNILRGAIALHLLEETQLQVEKSSYDLVSREVWRQVEIMVADRVRWTIRRKLRG